jgi:hypothetical protein
MYPLKVSIKNLIHRLFFCFSKQSNARYSYLKASTGFRVAARQLIQLTVMVVTTRTVNPASANTHPLVFDY